VTSTLPLSRDRILDVAVRVADRDGLDATSLRKVAAELGVHVTSLYNHLPTKDALLDGVAEDLMAKADLPVGQVRWEDWVRRFVGAMSQLATEHPGAFEVFMRRPVQGPRALATFEAALEALCGEGMATEQAFATLKAVTVAVLGCCVEQAGTTPAGSDLPMTDLTRLPDKDFPVIHQLVGFAEDVDVVGTLTEMLVFGIAALLPPKRQRKK
jgi:AcrR family transcriptional regulator